MNLRRMMAEAGLDYDSLQTAFKAGTIRDKLEILKAPSEDVDEIVKLVEEHFKKGTSSNNLDKKEIFLADHVGNLNQIITV